jgi:hypothetical protein
MYKTKKIVLSFCLISVSLAVSAQNKKLHNGIVYPEQWPPRYEEPAVAQDMPVPYLKEKPAVIPVNLGRQLFVDDFLIAETDLQPIYHTPNFYPQNPVLEPDKEWENTTEGAPYAAPFSDGIWYDEEDGRFKMWYLAGAGSIHKQDKQTFYTGYAESEDGKHWVKPKLDIYNQTNIVDTCNRDAATIWLDKLEKDPAKRYKMFNVERRPTDRRWQFILKYSADGIHWSNGVAQSGDLYDRSSAFYNPFRGVWALSMRYSTSVSSRSRSYLENVDPEVAVSMAHRIRKGVPDKNMCFWFQIIKHQSREHTGIRIAIFIYRICKCIVQPVMDNSFIAYPCTRQHQSARVKCQTGSCRTRVKSIVFNITQKLNFKNGLYIVLMSYVKIVTVIRS